MRFSINENQNAIFVREYEKFSREYLSRNRKAQDVPNPSDGWLAKIATNNNLCFSLWLMNGSSKYGRERQVVVCGNPLWKMPSENAYLCKECQDAERRSMHPKQMASAAYMEARNREKVVNVEKSREKVREDFLLDDIKIYMEYKTKHPKAVDSFIFNKMEQVDGIRRERIHRLMAYYKFENITGHYSEKTKQAVKKLEAENG